MNCCGGRVIARFQSTRRAVPSHRIARDRLLDRRLPAPQCGPAPGPAGGHLSHQRSRLLPLVPGHYPRRRHRGAAESACSRSPRCAAFWPTAAPRFWLPTRLSLSATSATAQRCRCAHLDSSRRGGGDARRISARSGRRRRVVSAGRPSIRLRPSPSFIPPAPADFPRARRSPAVRCWARAPPQCSPGFFWAPRTWRWSRCPGRTSWRSALRSTG